MCKRIALIVFKVRVCNDLTLEEVWEYCQQWFLIDWINLGKMHVTVNKPVKFSVGNGYNAVVHNMCVQIWYRGKLRDYTIQAQ